MVISRSSKTARTNGTDPRELVPTVEDADLQERVSLTPVKAAHVVKHPIAQHALSALRDINTGADQLRYFSHQLLSVLALEATASLPTREIGIEVKGSTHLGSTFARRVILISLARHGLGLTRYLPDLIPELSMGSLTLENSENSLRLEPRLHLANAPSLPEARVILFEPIVSSGLTAGIALNMFRKMGATDLSLISFVMSGPSLKRVQSSAPETNIWTGAIDEDYDPKRGPLPGLGDFGDRLYATK